MAAAVKEKKCSFNETTHVKVDDPNREHVHKCPECGTMWTHAENGPIYTGSRSAHKCPCCGTLQYERTDYGYSGPG